MVKLQEFNQTSSFAWSHDSLPLFATGTLAGAMDADFSSDSKLSIYSPFTNDTKPLVEFEAESKFYNLAWSKPSETHEKGLLAGALEDNSIQLWDVNKLLKDENASLNDANVGNYKKHSKAVHTVRFNPLQSHIMGSAGANKEIYIWDTKKGTSFAPGQSISPINKITSFSWNNSMSHIFAAAGDSGFTSIWDLKAKKEVLQLSYSGPTGRAHLSVVEWHPSQSTKLITASDNEGSSIICTWDLRNSNAPEIIMEGHMGGVLSLDWCQQDPNLLLSSGKDNSTILWNPIKGHKLCDYPSSPNWVHQTKFAPAIPDVFANASFDKKIIIQTLQDVSSSDKKESTDPKSTNDDDFWTELSVTDNQHPKFVEQQAPQWLKRPVTASFGYGGKLVTVSNDKTSHSVKITKINRDDIFSTTKDVLSKAIETGDFKGVCDAKVDSTSSLDSGDWPLLKTLLEKGEVALLEDKLSGGKINIEKDAEATKEGTPVSDEEDESDFFAKLGSEIAAEKKKESAKYKPEGTFNPFDNSNEVEAEIVNLILKGDFEKALDVCIENDQITEGLLIANHRPELKEKAENAYFSKKAKDSSLSRLLYSISAGNASDLVENADISSWKDIASYLLSFKSDKSSFQTNLTKLGNRLIESSVENARENALVCYMAGGALNTLAKIWLSEFKEIEKRILKNEKSGITSPYEAHIASLSEIIEKIMVYQSTVKDYATTSDFAELGEAYREYSEALANYGHYDLAYKLLQEVPETADGIKLAKERISKAFLKPTKSTSVVPGAQRKGLYNLPAVNSVKPVKSYPQAQPTGLDNSASYNPVAGGIPSSPANPIIGAGAGTFNPYASPSVSNGNGVPLRRSAPAPPNPYKPKTALDSLKEGPSYSTNAGSPLPPQPITAPPKPKKEVGGWNDLPQTLATPPAVVRTAQPAVPSAYSFQVPASPVRSHSRTASQPPSMPAPPRPVSRSSNVPSTSIPVNQNLPPRSSKYAPAVGTSSTNGDAPPPPVANVAHPPSRTISNPYAPKTEVNEPIKVPLPQPNIASPPPPVTTVPPRNPYAPKVEPPTATGGFVPPPRTLSGSSAAGNFPPPPTLGQPAGFGQSIPPPPAAGYIPTQPQQTGTASLPPPPPASSFRSATASASVSPSPPKANLASGDRSQISQEALPIYQTLKSEFERIKSKVPEKFSKQVSDSEKRLNILFDHLNNKDLLSETTIIELSALSAALSSGDFATAKKIQTDIAANKANECGNWMVGVKRLIGFCEAVVNL